MFINSTQETIIIYLCSALFTLFWCCIASNGILELYTVISLYVVLIILITYLIYLGIKYNKEEVEDCTMFLEEELNVKTIELKDLHKENHYGFLYVFIVSDDFTGWKYNAEGEDFVVITNELIEESL